MNMSAKYFWRRDKKGTKADIKHPKINANMSLNGKDTDAKHCHKEINHSRE